MITKFKLFEQKEEHTIFLYEIWNQISDELGLVGVEKIDSSVSSWNRIQVKKISVPEDGAKYAERFRKYDSILHYNLLMNTIEFTCNGRGSKNVYCNKDHKVVPDRVEIPRNITGSIMPAIYIYNHSKWREFHTINPAYSVVIYGEINDDLKEYIRRIERSKKSNLFDL